MNVFSSCFFINFNFASTHSYLKWCKLIMFEHVLLLIPMCNSITVAWWHYTKTLTFIFFHKNSAEVHRQQDSPPQRKVKNKHVSGRKNVLGSFYSPEQTHLVVSAIQRCHTVINTLSESLQTWSVAQLYHCHMKTEGYSVQLMTSESVREQPQNFTAVIVLTFVMEALLLTSMLRTLLLKMPKIKSLPNSFSIS